MSIKATHKAIERHTIFAANLRTDEEEERDRIFKEAQNQCAEVKLIEVTSSKELLRTTERRSLFDGPWLQGQDPPSTYTQIWKRKGGTVRPIGKAMMDITGMLDTARYTVWADISAKHHHRKTTPKLYSSAKLVYGTTPPDSLSPQTPTQR